MVRIVDAVVEHDRGQVHVCEVAPLEGAQPVFGEVFDPFGTRAVVEFRVCGGGGSTWSEAAVVAAHAVTGRRGRRYVGTASLYAVRDEMASSTRWMLDGALATHHREPASDVPTGNRKQTGFSSADPPTSTVSAGFLNVQLVMTVIIQYPVSACTTPGLQACETMAPTPALG
jgi:hypothetical protein